ncbi:uncharacterized protein LOC121725701 isoform X2 [Aricia agestis]|uniref:uncharacterized protein LOC121725701 isoform X2 n=1 Tax=Aricia agestis TaxID=91739 RepID=UPI001C207CC3|nr:uncharacterized protein LOC121725701 isoform X2 [Aricia agestis]
MTKKTDNQESGYDHVSVEAMHLVNEVLEEACIIVNTANESNDPWKYISCLKNYKNQDDAYDHNLTFVINKDCIKNLELDHSIITSTPQKGQGDEEIKLVNDNNNTSNSTSIYISQLFDIADLEAAEEEKDIEEIKESDGSIHKDIVKFIDHCLDISVSKLLTTERNASDCEDFVKENSNQLSQFVLEDVSEDIQNNDYIDVNIKINVTKTCNEASAAEDKKMNEKICLEDLCSYENAYLSLNRDDEQDFDTSELKLQSKDPRKIRLQEVDLTPEQDVVKKENFGMPTSSKNADLLTDSRKRTLIYRCRLQSRKILARLRSWLWRKSMRKYKISRGWTGAERGMSPLSPRVKRRASSVFDHWPSRATFSRSTWKFNTISGTFVNSALWKELGSKVQFRNS